MKLALPVCMALLALSVPVRAQDDGLTPEIAQCLRDYAASVEAVEPDLTKATDFLVVDACAGPIAKEQQRLNSQRIMTSAERNRAQCRERVLQQKQQDESAIPPRIGRIYENCDLNYDNVTANAQVLPILNIPQRPPAAVAMAAKLILDLRVAHNKSRP